VAVSEPAGVQVNGLSIGQAWKRHALPAYPEVSGVTVAAHITIPPGVEAADGTSPVSNAGMLIRGQDCWLIFVRPGPSRNNSGRAMEIIESGETSPTTAPINGTGNPPRSDGSHARGGGQADYRP